MKKYILIMAGGEGLRFGSEIPKQFALLAGKPVIMHAFEAFSALEETEFVLVLNEQWQELWKELCQTHNFKIEHSVVAGGPTRFHSVVAGMRLVTNPSLVAIHDAARPFVSKELIANAFKTAEQKTCAVPVVPVDESIRYVSGPHNKSLDRSQYRLVQTPQVFRSNLILQAYRQSFDEKFTDDASVLESIGYPVILIDGESENIKITTPLDLGLAELLIKEKGF
ncbi:MAG: 2-C-methyl-D-erythritol 4-phosphate cytidylyltransferase [Bacteroidales bacterium]|nr:2-C-methyl-D-erythritol 4-phosphate cytidylyltransferase [Bacteroidales bacterium]